MPRDADYFGAWPNGWTDESVGGLAPRAISDRVPSTYVSHKYTRFEATNTADVLQYVSPPFVIDLTKKYTVYMQSRKLSGTIAMQLVLVNLTNNGETVLWTGYAPGTTDEDKSVTINELAGSAPAFSFGMARVALVLRPTVGTVGAVAIHHLMIAQKELCSHHDGLVGGLLSGLHEVHYDGNKVFSSNFFNGFISVMTGAGVYERNLAGSHDPHEMTSGGAADPYLYCAEWTEYKVTKHNKATGALVASVTVDQNVFSVRILGNYLYASTTGGKIHKIQLSDFTLVASWTIGFDCGTTEATLHVAAGDLWIHAAQGGQVHRIDPATGTVKAVIQPPAGIVPSNYSFGTLKGKLYLAYNSGIMAEFDPATNTISRTWRIGITGTSQMKSDGEFLWFVSQEPYPALVRFDPISGIALSTRMRRVDGGKWCEIVGGEVWCGGLFNARIERFARY